MTDTVGYATLQIIPSTKGFTSALSTSVRTPLTKVGTDAGAAAGAGYKKSFLGGIKGVAGPLAALIGVGAGVQLFGDMIGEAREAGRVSRSTAQLIKTTGGAANLTATQVGNLAGRLSDYAAVDDELIQSGENVLLTFKNVQNQVGAGNDIFSRATKAALDMSDVLGSDLNGAVLQLGKALNDPIKGVTALGRAGVQFTEQQKAQIAALVESNDLLGAQKIILKEVEGQVGGAAGASKDSIDELGVAFKNLEESAGTLALPAVQNFSEFAVNDAIPAIEATGGAVGDAADAFGSLPSPVKAAAVSLAAVAVINKTIGFSTLATGASRASGAFDGLRLRTMLAADAFRQARTYSVDLEGNLGRISPQLSRTAATMAATRAATVGLGTALKSSLGGVVGALGGPWGIALAGAAVALTVFADRSAKAAQVHAELKAQAQSVADALDQETGALTRNADEQNRKLLADSGAFDAAEKLGISLSVVTKAAEGNSAALANVKAQIDAIPKGDIFEDGGLTDTGQAIATLGGQINITSDAIDDQRHKIDQINRSREQDNDTTVRYTASIKQLKDQLFGDQQAADAARRAHDRLADALADSIRGNIGYKQAVHDAFKEAQDGNRTLDINTEAGRKNRLALLDVSDAWNALSTSAKSVPGRYKQAREEFERVARAMGATNRQADRLAKKLLDLPKKTIEVPIKLTTVNSGRKQGVALPGFATGGYTGPGGKYEPAGLVHKGEWVFDQAKTSQYRLLFEAIQAGKKIPGYAQGGPVGSVPSSSTTYSTQASHTYHLHGISSMRELDREAQRRSRASSNGSPVF